jgi:hypothetical protein
MGFKTLILKEQLPDGTTDSRFIIIYDVNEENIFYYGTRNVSATDKYKDFNGFYNYKKIDVFVSFLVKSLGDINKTDVKLELNNKITYELHDIPILKTEYDSLSFSYLYDKVLRSTELFAYDESRLTRLGLYDLVSMLIPHV